MTADRFPGKIGIRDPLVISCCCRWTTAPEDRFAESGRRVQSDRHRLMMHATSG